MGCVTPSVLPHSFLSEWSPPDGLRFANVSSADEPVDVLLASNHLGVPPKPNMIAATTEDFRSRWAQQSD